MTPYEFSEIVKKYQNNSRNNELHANTLITYTFNIEQDESGYWHMHMFFFVKADRLLAIDDKKERYRQYIDLLNGYYWYFEGLLISLNLNNSIYLNISNRLPEQYRDEERIVFSKSDDTYSHNSDVYWLSYGVKVGDEVSEWYSTGGKVRLFGKGIVR